MKKLTILASALIATSISTTASAANPPMAPSLYGNGPQSPLINKTDMSDAEKGGYALLEGVMQVAEAKIHATSCAVSAGTYSITQVFSDGTQGNRAFNFVDVVSPGGSFSLDADLKTPVTGRGQKLHIKQDGTGSLNGTAVADYNGRFTYNDRKNMMVAAARVDVMGANGRLDRYQSKVIKDFSRGATKIGSLEYYMIYDWGLQSLSKLKYPVEKYWQRSKSLRSDAYIGHTVFVKDRLVGPTSCRITIETRGDNVVDFFDQSGTLKIAVTKPSAPVPEFNNFTAP